MSIPVAVCLGFLTLTPVTGLVMGRSRLPAPLTVVYGLAQSFRIVSSYGLFAMMTTSRPEIIIEGSEDGATWRPYEFRYKAGDMARRPPWFLGHMPRLDWQMWFAALGTSRDNPWLLRFCQRLLEGSPSVLKLLARNPFSHAPPRYVRAIVYDYHFSDAATRRATGAWWTRTLVGAYAPALSLRSASAGEASER